mgnify:FL=1
MSEQEQHFENSGTNVSRETSGPETGAPAKPSSGFVGRGGAREREELSPQAEVEPSGLCPEEITPEQQMLYDIIDSSMAEVRKKSAGDTAPEDPAPPQEEPELEQQDPPPPPQKNKPSSFYIYLAVLFGAAFMMLLLAYFVQQRNNTAAMDDLRMTSNASREELLEEIEALKKENESLTKENGRLNDWADQKSEEAKQLNDTLDQTYYRTSDLTIEKQALYYLWYLQQFMDQGDYTLAAAEIVFSTDFWRSAWENEISLNSALLEQYDAARQELIRRGYLQQLDHIRDGGTDIYFTSRWNPNENNDMAALSILWCALEAHFVLEEDNGASQYLFLYPLSSPATGYQERVERLASGFTLEQFQLMKDELVEDSWLAVAEDGTMSEGNYMGAKNDMLYGLPFELPPLEYPLQIPIP